MAWKLWCLFEDYGFCFSRSWSQKQKVIANKDLNTKRTKPRTSTFLRNSHLFHVHFLFLFCFSEHWKLVLIKPNSCNGRPQFSVSIIYFPCSQFSPTKQSNKCNTINTTHTSHLFFRRRVVPQCRHRRPNPPQRLPQNLIQTTINSPQPHSLTNHSQKIHSTNQTINILSSTKTATHLPTHNPQHLRFLRSNPR